MGIANSHLLYSWPMASKRVARKVGVGIVGGTVVATGIVLIPLPGPGTLIVLGGLAILGTEFDAARRGADRIKGAVRRAVGMPDDGEDGSATDTSD